MFNTLNTRSIPRQCRAIVAGSVTTRAQGAADKVLPDQLEAAIHRKMAEPTD